MQLEFRVTWRQQLLVLLPFFTIDGMILAGELYLFGKEAMLSYLLILNIVGIVLLVLPVIVLHATYLARNGGAVLVVDTRLRTMTYSKKGIEKTWAFQDIAKLKYVASAGHYYRRGKFETYPFDGYRFYKFEFTDGTVLFITSFMINDIEHTLEQLLGVEAKWKLRVIAFLY